MHNSPLTEQRDQATPAADQPSEKVPNFIYVSSSPDPLALDKAERRYFAVMSQEAA